jgi:hypothetical protein
MFARQVWLGSTREERAVSPPRSKPTWGSPKLNPRQAVFINTAVLPPLHWDGHFSLESPIITARIGAVLKECDVLFGQRMPWAFSFVRPGL